ncbi:MAG: DUF1572 family protein [Chitinophagaceae bacterium]
MLTEILSQLFTRDLNKLKAEILAYRNENKIWIIDKEIKNSAGNLCLHLIGNLNTYIGAQMGNSGYQRDRESEFSLKDIPVQQLVKMIEETIVTIQSSLERLPASALAAQHPFAVFEHKTSTEFLLVHLATHLSYHLGQVNYHRRLLDL